MQKHDCGESYMWPALKPQLQQVPRMQSSWSDIPKGEGPLLEL
jgi:hypothetical protein